jgi:hypothetical protein
MRRPALMIFMVVWAAPVLAATISQRPDKVTLMIYEDEAISTAELVDPGSQSAMSQNGIAYISESRTIDLPAGPSTIEFRGVMSTIVPQTADIHGLPADVLEQNFDYDLLSPTSLLAESIGQAVDLVRTDPDTGKLINQTAIIRSGPSGTMLEINGTMEALHCSGLPEKLVFAKIPDGLRDTPTLSVRAVMPEAGRYTVTLSYIATGLYWSADYNARIRPDGHSLDLTGWITLANYSDSGYKRIPVELIAGRTYTTDNDHPISTYMPRPTNTCWPIDIHWATAVPRLSALYLRLHGNLPADIQSVPIAVTAYTQQEMKIEPSRLGDYKLYSLPEATDVAVHQTKQVQFLDQHGVSLERVYTYVVTSGAHTRENAGATSLLRLHNTDASGLGKPLPAGTVSVLEDAPDGSPVLAGQHSVYDTPAGAPLEIETGRAINVRVQQREIETKTIGSGKAKLTHETYEIVVENDKSVPINFELAQPMADGVRLIAEDLPHSIEPKGMIWSFALAAGERKDVQFTIERTES